MELTIVVIMIELVYISLVGLGDPEVLPRASPWFHTKVSRLPECPVAVTGLERRRIWMTLSLMPWMGVLVLPGVRLVLALAL